MPHEPTPNTSIAEHLRWLLSAAVVLVIVLSASATFVGTPTLSSGGSSKKGQSAEHGASSEKKGGGEEKKDEKKENEGKDEDKGKKEEEKTDPAPATTTPASTTTTTAAAPAPTTEPTSTSLASPSQTPATTTIAPTVASETPTPSQPTSTTTTTTPEPAATNTTPSATTETAVVVPEPTGTRWWDSTPPGLPSHISVVAAPNAVTLRWSDPLDGDLATIDILRNIPPSTAVSGTPITRVPRGDQQYTDAAVVMGTTYVYILRAQDGAGNVRLSEAIAVTTPVPLFRTTSEEAPDEQPTTDAVPPIVRFLYGVDWPDRLEAFISLIQRAVH